MGYNATISAADRDAVYGHVVKRRLRALGIRDRPTAPRSPWQNAYVERLIGSLRRECIDQVIVFGETHLRRIVSMSASYYNGTRTHLSLGKDAPSAELVPSLPSPWLVDCITATRESSIW